MSRPISILLCLLALLLAIPAVAQKDKTKKSKKELKQEAIYDLIAQETCDCMDGKDVSKMKSEDIEMQLGICMLGSYSKHSGDLEETTDLNNSAGMEALGEKIGILMFGKCPQTLMAVAGGMQEEPALVEDPAGMGADELYWEDGGEELTGVLVRLSNTGDVGYLVLKDEAGVEHELMWLRYFEGSEALLENPDAGIGRKVIIYSVPMEIYVPKTRDYAVRKEIRALTFVE